MGLRAWEVLGSGVKSCWRSHLQNGQLSWGCSPEVKPLTLHGETLGLILSSTVTEWEHVRTGSQSLAGHF